MRSPLLIEGSKATAIIKKLIPESSTVTSMLFHDGTIEVPLAHSNRIVVARTGSYAVYEFWMSLLMDAEALAESVKFLHDKLSEPEMYLLQDNWFSYKRTIERSSFFYILNRCSEMNYASHGKISKNRLKKITISSLKRFKVKGLVPLHDKTGDIKQAIENAQSTDFILITAGDYRYNFFDYGQNYGPDMVMINHKNIKTALDNTDSKWILVYNKHPAVFKLYEKYNITMIDKRGNKTDNRDTCSEIVVNNFVSI